LGQGRSQEDLNQMQKILSRGESIDSDLGYGTDLRNVEGLASHLSKSTNLTTLN
jgi:hypothetical protein